jgi:hypothetical protein
VSDADTLRAFGAGPDALERAVRDLPSVRLDAARSPGAWSTRAIVHHLADGEAHWLTCIKIALLGDGVLYRHNNWLQDASAEALVYASRDIAPSLALFRANREHVAQLLRDIRGAWDRCVLFEWSDASEPPRRTRVRDVVEMEVRHVTEHLAEIAGNLAAG